MMAIKTFLIAFGFVYLAAFVLGGLGLIDFQICVAAPGQCRVEIKAPSVHEVAR
ncbi:MAG: hypothetical protein VB131_06840 [Burkholderia gladioli]